MRIGLWNYGVDCVKSAASRLSAMAKGVWDCENWAQCFKRNGRKRLDIYMSRNGKWIIYKIKLLISPRRVRLCTGDAMLPNASLNHTKISATKMNNRGTLGPIMRAAAERPCRISPSQRSQMQCRP